MLTGQTAVRKHRKWTVVRMNNASHNVAVTNDLFDEVRIGHWENSPTGRKQQKWILTPVRRNGCFGVRMRPNGVDGKAFWFWLGSRRRKVPLQSDLKTLVQICPGSRKPFGWLCAAFRRRWVPNPNHDLTVAI